MQASAILREAGYDSKEEAAWALLCHDELEHQGYNLLETIYHPFTLYIAGGKYTPDFLHIVQISMATSIVLIVEVKGSKKQRNYRDARTHLRSAANKFDFWRFAEVRINIKSGAVEFEVIDGR